jgi:hypothetical protein
VMRILRFIKNIIEPRSSSLNLKCEAGFGNVWMICASSTSPHRGGLRSSNLSWVHYPAEVVQVNAWIEGPMSATPYVTLRSSVSIVTRLQAGRQGFDSRQGQGIFLFATAYTTLGLRSFHSSGYKG